MAKFIPDPDRVRSLDQYLETLSQMKKNAVARMFDLANEIFPLINKSYGVEIEKPKIKIQNEKFPSAECTEYLIYINVGLIDHCLNGQFGFCENIISDDAARSEIQWLGTGTESVIFSWAIAHEYFHIVRKHTEFLDSSEVTDEAYKAIEYDADLCAIASIYKLLYFKLKKSMGDQEIRNFVLYCVFWQLKLFPQPVTNNTHISSNSRISHIVNKLAILPRPDDKTRSTDVDFALDITKDYLRGLIFCLVRCEKECLKLRLMPNEKTDVADAMESYSSDQHKLTIPFYWNEIKDRVSSISNTVT